MTEFETSIKEDKATQLISTEFPRIEDEGYLLRDGYSGHQYRGKHRSHLKGKGYMAYLRSLWQQRYHRLRIKSISSV